MMLIISVSVTGPQPILPRPGPYGAMSPYAPQAYALIPLQSVSQSYGVSPGIPQSPVIVNLPNPGQTMSACPSPVISESKSSDQEIYEPRHEKSCFCNIRTTKTQLSLHVRAV